MKDVNILFFSIRHSEFSICHRNRYGIIMTKRFTSKVQGVLVDALGVDEEEVTPKAPTSSADLGAESIDYLDIVLPAWRKPFTTDPARKFTIPRGELFPEDKPVHAGTIPDSSTMARITPRGDWRELRKRMPYTDLERVREGYPRLEKAQDLVTVDMITNYVAAKLNG